MLVSAVFAPRAHADDMDLALERLVEGGNGEACQGTLANPPMLRAEDGSQALAPDNDAWGALMSELGGATMPSLLQPVTTSGPKGVDAMLAQTLARISSDAEYWARGSRGSGRGAQRDCSGRNRFVKNLITRSQLRLIKSLPYGISFGSTLTKVWNTDLWTFGGELKIALFEGYRRVPFPDIAIRAAANTVVGDNQYTLTNLATSVILSKPIVVARIMRITPYAAYQTGISFASSSLIDLTPGTDAFELCDSEPGAENGTLACRGDNDDLGNDQPFEDLILLRHQVAVGMVLRYHLMTLTTEFLMDVIPIPESDDQVPGDVARQWTFSVSPGVSF